jgi:hypothetical protein
MTRRTALVPLLGALLFSGAASATDITFFEFDGFSGRRFVASNSVSDFSAFGFNDLASSVMIRSGAWQLCTDAFFRGRCVTLERGDYPSLGAMGLSNRISSAREVGWSGGTGGGGDGRAGVTLFEFGGFGGQQLPVEGVNPNLQGRFNDRAQSMIVHSGTWEVCADANFAGECRSFGPGRYASLGSLSGQVSSLREIQGPAGGGGNSGSGGGGDRRASATLYEFGNFGGEQLPVDGLNPNLQGRFNDRAQSMIVHSGTWEVCADGNFAGECRSFGPGRHASLGSLSGQVSSLRAIQGPAGAGGSWPGGGWGAANRAVLYENTGLAGRSFVVAEFMPNLNGTGFNNRASSLRVERGYWLFCSEADFSGQCRTFGPGDYPTLPQGLTNRISSGRRISEDYPYNRNPNWGN